MIVFSIVLGVISAIVSQIISTPFELNWIKDVEWFDPPKLIDGMEIVLVITAVFVAPIFETALFQAFPYVILRRFKTMRGDRWWIVIIGGVIFGAQHFYSLQYMLVTTFMGAIMMYGYIVKFKNLKTAYWSLVVFHALWNAMVVAIDYLS